MARKAGEEGGAPPAAQEGGAAQAAPQMSTEEYKEALYRRLMAGHREIDAEIEKVRSALKALGKKKTQVRNQLKQAGFFLSNVDNVLGASGKQRDANEQPKVDQLHWMREIEGLPNARSGEQLDLLSRLPETEKSAIAWEEDAYHQGVIGQPCELPAACPPVFHQRWTQKWHEGKDRRDWALAAELNPERDMSKAQDFLPAAVDHSAPEEPDDDEPDLIEGAPTDEEIEGAMDAGAGFDAEAEAEAAVH